MIKYPYHWKNVGQPITISCLERTIIRILQNIGCNNLAFSGGIDSSLLLHYMSNLYNSVNAFTIGISPEHPDVVYAKRMVKLFHNVKHYIYIPTENEINSATQENDFDGDNAVRLLYEYANKYATEIIAGDGIDEFVCGYYDHQKNPTEDTYFKYIHKLQEEQLIPLNNNSGKIKVYLPYIDNSLISLLSQIPLKDKVDFNCRKKIMVKLAENKIPIEIIDRWKYGFCHALTIKK